MSSSDAYVRQLADVVKHRNAMNRRRFLSMTGGAVAMSLGAGLVSGCGDEDGPGAAKQLGSGTIKLGGYPDWIGSDELAGFARANPGDQVKLVAISGDQSQIAKLATDPSAVDIMLMTENEVQAAIDLGVVAKIASHAVPNYRNIDSEFKVGFASDQAGRCVATDYGKTGFAYRKDLVKERLTSWSDVWRVAPKYSGKITFLNYPKFVIGTGLILSGESISSTDESTVTRAADRIIDIKPHLKSFVDTDLSKGLLDGSAVIAMDWDYDVFVAQQSNDDIEWVAPEDGIHAYLDVWVPINRSQRLPVVWKFFDFAYEPKNYANFVNTLGIAFCMSAARPYIKRAIKSSPILYPPKSVLERVRYQQALGEGQRVWDRQWQRIKAA